MSDEAIRLYRKPHCPSGTKALNLLQQRGYNFHDHVFADKAEEQSFKQKYDVATTPQVQWDGRWIGGYEALAEYLGADGDSSAGKNRSYMPVIAVFVTAALLSLASQDGWMGFMGYSLAILACLKLMDIDSFVEGFRQYDLLTPYWPAYGRLYPFIELGIALCITAGFAPIWSGITALLVGLLGAISVVKAVYIEKRDLNCACIGGNSRAPLGAVSLSENLMMLFMGVFLLYSSLLITW